MGVGLTAVFYKYKQSTSSRQTSPSSTWLLLPLHPLSTYGTNFCTLLLLLRLLSHPTKQLSCPPSPPPQSPATFFPAPSSLILCRPISASKPLAMAEHTSSNPAAPSHKHSNRLAGVAAEHSPYLLQHAHNPVSLNFRTGFSVLCCLDCSAS